MPRTCVQYLRFIVPGINSGSGVPDGLFSTAFELRDDPETPAYDCERLADILKWFDVHLKAPTRFNRTNSKARFHRTTKGICWLKASAHVHVDMMREMAAIIEEYGHFVTQLKTDRPGYIVYQDIHQIVAEPFADTLTY